MTWNQAFFYILSEFQQTKSNMIHTINKLLSSPHSKLVTILYLLK